MTHDVHGQPLAQLQCGPHLQLAFPHPDMIDAPYYNVRMTDGLQFSMRLKTHNWSSRTTNRIELSHWLPQNVQNAMNQTLQWPCNLFMPKLTWGASNEEVTLGSSLESKCCMRLPILINGHNCLPCPRPCPRRVATHTHSKVVCKLMGAKKGATT